MVSPLIGFRHSLNSRRFCTVNVPNAGYRLLLALTMYREIGASKNKSLRDCAGEFALRSVASHPLLSVSAKDNNFQSLIHPKSTKENVKTAVACYASDDDFEKFTAMFSKGTSEEIASMDEYLRPRMKMRGDVLLMRIRKLMDATPPAGSLMLTVGGESFGVDLDLNQLNMAMGAHFLHSMLYYELYMMSMRNQNVKPSDLWDFRNRTNNIKRLNAWNVFMGQDVTFPDGKVYTTIFSSIVAQSGFEGKEIMQEEAVPIALGQCAFFAERSPVVEGLVLDPYDANISKMGENLGTVLSKKDLTALGLEPV